MEKKSSSIKVVEMGCSVCGKKVLFVEDTTKDAVLMCPTCAAKDPGGRVVIIGKLGQLDTIKEDMDKRSKKWKSSFDATGDEVTILWLIVELENERLKNKGVVS